METGLDNANATNNPFANSNGTEILQQKDGLLLNLTEGFKQNGAELSPTNDYVYDKPTNGKRPAEEFDEDEDMGPETDVDALDDSLLSPASEQPTIDNKTIEAFDPFTTDIEEKVNLEIDLNIQKQQTSEFEPPRSPREETPTPPADEVHDAGVEENVADSGEDSEDEWNYYQGDSAKSEKVSSSKADREVAELTKTAEEDEEEAMSQLNPNAAEFVPISSPTRNVSSPACRALIDDQVIAQSPRRATPSEIDINLPNPQDFEKEVKNRPSDIFSNGQENDNNQRLSSQEVMENFLNGKNIDDIEFHPSTPHKATNPEEFHFGPNATPFSTPAKLLDQSEAALSTKAVFGDESSYLEGKALVFETSFTTESSNITPFAADEDAQDFQPQLNKQTDPMSMSFYQDESETNPFDLNKVQMLPDDEEIQERPEKISTFNDTISDLPEHDPLGEGEPIVTDLDKLTDSQELTEDSNLMHGVSKLPETPEPALNIETCELAPAISPILIEASNAPLPITPEPNSEEQDARSALKTPDVVSPLPQENVVVSANDISSLICSTESKLPSLKPDVDEFGFSDLQPCIDISLLLERNLNAQEEQRISPELFSKPIDKLIELSKSPEPTDDELCQTLDALTRPDSKSPTAITPEPSVELLCQSKSAEPIDLETSPMPTPEPTTELSEEVCSAVGKKVERVQGEFFPIWQKKTHAFVNLEEQVKDNLITTEEEFFPICSKPQIFESHDTDRFAEQIQDSYVDRVTSPGPISDNMHDIRVESQLPHESCSKSPAPSNILENPSLQDTDDLETQSKSVPTSNLAKSPEPTVDLSIESAINFTNTNIVEPALDFLVQSKSPEPNLAELDEKLQFELISAEEQIDRERSETRTPITELPVATSDLNNVLLKSTEFDSLKQNDFEICNVSEIPSIASESILPKEPFEASEQLLADEIQNIIDATESAMPTESEAKSPETVEEFLDSEKRDLESPMEDITSSVKDDNSITPEIIEEAKDTSTEKEMIRDSFVPQLETMNLNYTQELSNALQEANETLIGKETVCQISSTPNTTISEQADTESVNTADVNSFLERSNMPDVTSPLSSSGQSLQQVFEAHLNDPLSRCIYPLLTEDVVKTDVIAPQYPEEAVITPTEETKPETPTATVEEKEAPTALSEVELEAEAKEMANETIIAATAAVGATAAVAVVAATTAVVKERKSLAKVPPTAKKPSKPGFSPTKTTTSKPIAAKIPTSAKPGISSPTKLVPSKTTKTSTTPKTAPTSKLTPKPSPKLKIESVTARLTEKKPLMNGDVKTTAKAPLTARKPLTSTTKSSITAKSPLLPKPSPTKIEPKPTTKVSSSTTRTSSSSTAVKSSTLTSTTKNTTSAPKPRPTSLSSKTTGSSSTAKTTSTVSATKTTVQSKLSTTASSPKSTIARPKPPTNLATKSPTVSAAPKSRLLTTRMPTAKGPDTEKQLKDTVNKQLTSSRTSSTTKTSGTLSTAKTTTTVKKTETKAPISTRTTTTKTTITAIKSTTKKPTEVTRINTKKTAPTKTNTMKAQQNGLTNGVTTIVQETTTILSTEPQLIKDLSPVENKLLVDNSQLTETNVAD